MEIKAKIKEIKQNNDVVDVTILPIIYYLLFYYQRIVTHKLRKQIIVI